MTRFALWTSALAVALASPAFAQESNPPPALGAGVSALSTACPPSGPTAGAVTLNNNLPAVEEIGSFTAGCGNGYHVVLSGAATATVPITGVVPAISNDATSTNSLTIAPTSGLIDGLASISLPPGETIGVWGNGVNAFSDLARSGSGGSSTHATNVISIPFSASPFSYTPTTGMIADDVYCIGGGGGGGSGAYVASGTAASGGAGGSSSVGAFARFTAAQIGAGPITVTIGAGGAGGVVPAGGSSGAWTQSAGGNGGAGGNSTFGSLLFAGGGGGSAGGQIAAAAGSGSTGAYTSAGASATGSSAGSLTGAIIAISGATGNATLSLPAIFQGGIGGGGINGAQGGFAGQGIIASGGGAGGGISTGAAAFSGNAGGRGPYATTNALGHSAGVAGDSGVTITGSLTYSRLTPGGYAGGVGGGGGGSSVTSGTAGGAGGQGDIGAGGGGGGSTLTTNTATAGAGGAGGNGACAIVEFF